MTEQEEQYIYFASCIDNLNQAWCILQEVKKHTDKGNSLVSPAFQFALVEYSKPYLESRSIVKTKRQLSIKHIPSKYRKLHNEIITARNQIHAHSDLTIKDASLYVSNINHRNYVGIAQNIIDTTGKLSEIDAIIELIDQSLDSMYLEAERLRAALPPSSDHQLIE